jgi:LPPG:FO 2-phospho-L-lactate transferase
MDFSTDIAVILSRTQDSSNMKVVALAGGVGGAKLAHGLALVLPPEDLTVVVNTADDFEHLGLHICPDLDTVCYTLAGLANPEAGWGRMHETWQALANLEKLGGPAWFQLGDQDLGTHLERTRRLNEGQTLTQITRDFCRAWGVEPAVLPMSDQSVRTIVDTDAGELNFQEYFVKRRCEPRVKGFRFEGIESAEAPARVLDALAAAEIVIICPSNPWVSIGPILALPGLRFALTSRQIAAVSPIIAGAAIKGPAAKMYAELGIQPSALAVAEQYRQLATAFVLDRVDSQLAAGIRDLGMQPLVTNTIMNTLEDRRRLAEDVLHFVGNPS